MFTGNEFCCRTSQTLDRSPLVPLCTTTVTSFSDTTTSPSTSQTSKMVSLVYLFKAWGWTLTLDSWNFQTNTPSRLALAMLTSSTRQFTMLGEKRFSSIIEWTSRVLESPTSRPSGNASKHSTMGNFNWTIYGFRLTPLQTCHSFTDCGTCLENEIKFKCNWCPSLNRCSSGVDRKRQEWTNSGEWNDDLCRRKHSQRFICFRLRQDANIRWCKAMQCCDHRCIDNIRVGEPIDDRQVVAECFSSYSTSWTAKVQRWICHIGLLRLCNNLRRRLLGVLCLHSSA